MVVRRPTGSMLDWLRTPDPLNLVLCISEKYPQESQIVPADPDPMEDPPSPLHMVLTCFVSHCRMLPMVVRRPPGSMLDWLRTPDPLNLVLCISEKYLQESQIVPADPDPMEDPLSPLHMVLTCFVSHCRMLPMVVRRPLGSMLDWLRTPDPLNLVLCISEKYLQESQIVPADPDAMEDPLSPLHMVLTCFVWHCRMLPRVRRPPGSMLDWLRTPDPLNLVLCISEKYPQESQILPADPDPMEDPLSPLHMVLTCFVCHCRMLPMVVRRPPGSMLEWCRTRGRLIWSDLCIPQKETE